MKTAFAGLLRLYGALLYLYPKPFRDEFAGQMRLTLRDGCRNAYRHGRTVGVVLYGLSTMLDLFTSALTERRRQEEESMSKERVIALAGPMTMLVGALWVLASVGEFVLLARLGSPDSFWDIFWFFPFIFSFVPMLFALLGTRWRFQQALGLPGKIGLTLSVAGCAGMILFVLFSILLGTLAPQVEQGWWADVVMAVMILSIMIGYLLFGVDTARFALLARWNLAPIVVGAAVIFRVLPELLGLRAYDSFQLGSFVLYFLIAGTGWILVGMAMMETDTKQQAMTAS